ncbi:asparagine synthase (glutamine-hydrolyzing) [Inquilinus sp. OTU3971]|uniref:asparagine synthase (glutamine-hydrolyzing) n=1 Tax=Inquilinus sp. OTU3971 TaxID=3043855 RepID=UPI00313EE1FB
MAVRMCGIVGLFSSDRDRPIDPGHLRAMTGRLRHRGPDDGGAFAAGGVALGFTRLSIVDLATGNQPHHSEDGQITSVCNGEIFNHRELRQELERRGHSFRTRCDVEVLVHLYEDYGADFVSKLNGQFAFALYDRRRHRLLLGRDHVGIAPLFYTEAGGELLFGSEIKALLAHPAVERRVDLAGLDQILTFPGMVSPTTMFQGIHALPPGHVLEVGSGPARAWPYWDLVYPEAARPAERRETEFYVARLEELLLASVRRRLDADVPVGFYLSGGLDSSLIGALAQAAAPDRLFHSYSITFPQADIDERRPQRLMAERLGSRHHEIEFPPAEILRRLRQAVAAAEAPLKEAYNTCSLALSAMVRESGHKVVLTGEGADELFAGYVGYRLDVAGGRVPGTADPLEAMLEDEVRAELWGDPAFFYERDYRLFRDAKAGLYSPAVAATLPQFDCTLRPPVDRSCLAGRHPLHQRSYADFKLRLADHLLADHGDRVSYANSIEARYPFLDIEVVEFVRSIPPDLLVRDDTEKWLLRQIARRYLPPAVAGREKFSFVAPGSPYLLAQRVDWIDDLLSPELIRRQNYFDAETVERLRRQHLAGNTRINATFDTDVLMLVLTFGLFLEEFEMPSYA